jgi:hypothetical protein
MYLEADVACNIVVSLQHLTILIVSLAKVTALLIHTTLSSIFTSRVRTSVMGLSVTVGAWIARCRFISNVFLISTARRVPRIMMSRFDGRILLVVLMRMCARLPV